MPKTQLPYKIPTYSNNIPFSQVDPALVLYSRNNGRYTAEIPNRRGFQTYQTENSNNYLHTPQSYNSETAIGQLAVQGARNFYSGVQQASQILGFNFGR